VGSSALLACCIRLGGTDGAARTCEVAAFRASCCSAGTPQLGGLNLLEAGPPAGSRRSESGCFSRFEHREGAAGRLRWDLAASPRLEQAVQCQDRVEIASLADGEAVGEKHRTHRKKRLEAAVPRKSPASGLAQQRISRLKMSPVAVLVLAPRLEEIETSGHKGGCRDGPECRSIRD